LAFYKGYTSYATFFIGGIIIVIVVDIDSFAIGKSVEVCFMEVLIMGLMDML